MSHSSNPSAVHNSRMGLRRDFWSSCSLEESKPITDSDLRLDLNRNYISPCTISFRDELLFDLSYVLAVIDLFYHLQQLFIQNTFISQHISLSTFSPTILAFSSTVKQISLVSHAQQIEYDILRCSRIHIQHISLSIYQSFYSQLSSDEISFDCCIKRYIVKILICIHQQYHALSFLTLIYTSFNLMYTITVVLHVFTVIPPPF